MIHCTASTFSSVVMVDERSVRGEFSKPRSESLDSATRCFVFVDTIQFLTDLSYIQACLGEKLDDLSMLAIGHVFRNERQIVLRIFLMKKKSRS